MKTFFKELSKPMKCIDLSILFDDYNGKWVALDKYAPDYRVISSGTTMTAAYNKAKKSGFETPVVFKISKKMSLAATPRPRP